MKMIIKKIFIIMIFTLTCLLSMATIREQWTKDLKNSYKSKSERPKFSRWTNSKVIGSKQIENLIFNENDTVTLEGTFNVGAVIPEEGAYRGQKMPLYILVLDKPISLKSWDYTAKDISEVEIILDNNKIAKLKSKNGKRIKVKGEVFLWHTAHHHREIMMSVTEIF